MQKIAKTVAAVLLLGLTTAGYAGASQICDRLGFALANLSEQVGPTAEARKYARAIAAQKQSLRQLGVNIKQAGCSSGSVLVIGGQNEGECSHLVSKRSRMERNLEILENKRISLLSTEQSGLDRRRLIAALDENRCNQKPVLVNTPGNDSAQPLVNDDPDGLETIRVPSTETNYRNSQFVDLGGTSMNGNYRTMCVRTCDGAYFPVSSHASTTDFQRDAQVCSMMCPGTDTELYYHSLQSESADMRSTQSGRPYDELKNAFRFRTEKPGSKPQCGCNFALYYKEMMKRQSYINDPDSLPVRADSIVWLKPALRSSLPNKLAVNTPERKEHDYIPSHRIRVIGPKFLPDTGIDFSKHLSDAAQ